MKPTLPILLFLLAGCSSAPVADFLDWVSPSPVRPQAGPVAPTPPPVPPSIVVQPPPPSPPPTTVNRPPVESSRSDRPMMSPLPDVTGSR